MTPLRRVHPGTLVLWVLLLATAQKAAAQETTGTLKGTALDEQGLAVPGVTITVAGSQGTKTTTTDTQGRFSVPFLTLGPYTVRAELKEFKTQEKEDVVVSLGQTPNLAFTMALGDRAETVTVRSGTVTIDSTTTTVGAVISSELAASVPVGRRVSDVIYMAPGVSSGGSVGRANPSMAGGSGLDNQYVIDGVNITNQGFGALGSYSIMFGSLGNATPFDFVQEVQVKTGGYQAEFGQALGGVVNVVTKSGSNRLRGSVFGYARPSGLEKPWKQFQSTNGTVQTLGSQQGDIGMEVGGPIVRDRLFFFGAIDTQWNQRTLQAPEGFPLNAAGGIDQNRHNLAYATKLTFQVSGSHRIDASFFGDPSTGAMGAQRISSLLGTNTASFSRITYGGHNQTVRYDGTLFPRWLLEATFSRTSNQTSEVPSVDTWQVFDETATPTVTTGGLGFYEGNQGVSTQWTVKATHVRANHQIRSGAEYDDIGFTPAYSYTGSTFLAPDGQRTSSGAIVSTLPDVAFGKIYHVNAFLTPGAGTKQSYVSAFVQDTWKATHRLTVNAGLRYEQETMSASARTLPLTGNWAARLGATYDPTGTGRLKVFANAGRFYAQVPNLVAASNFGGLVQMTADYYDAALTRPIANGVVTQTPDGAVTATHFTVFGGSEALDPHAKLPYTNEFVVGLEREVQPGLLVGVTYMYRSLGRVLEDTGNVPVVAFALGVPGTDSAVVVVTNPSAATPIFPTAQYLGAAFDDPKRQYQAVAFTVHRVAEHWSVLASYQWSRLRGNYDGFFRDDNAASNPACSVYFNFPTNDPSYTSIGAPQFGYRGDIRYLGQSGILPLDRPHQGKVFVTRALGSRLSLAAGLNLNSGKPLTPLAAHPFYGWGGEIPEGPRGSGILTVDGFKSRTPFEGQVDLQASYHVKLNRDRQLTLLTEVFNVFDERRPLDYDTWTESSFGVPNPDFGKPISQVTAGPQFQAPRALRFGARFSF